jgi:hypothetical protein
MVCDMELLHGFGTPFTACNALASFSPERCFQPIGDTATDVVRGPEGEFVSSAGVDLTNVHIQGH